MKHRAAVQLISMYCSHLRLNLVQQSRQLWHNPNTTCTAHAAIQKRATRLCRQSTIHVSCTSCIWSAVDWSICMIGLWHLDASLKEKRDRRTKNWKRMKCSKLSYRLSAVCVYLSLSHAYVYIEHASFDRSQSFSSWASSSLRRERQIMSFDWPGPTFSITMYIIPRKIWFDYWAIKPLQVNMLYYCIDQVLHTMKCHELSLDNISKIGNW